MCQKENVDHFLYLTANEHLLRFASWSFRDLQRRVYFGLCHRLAPAVARHASLQLEGEPVCSTQDFACSMTARPHANFPSFGPKTTMATLRNQLNSLLEQMGLGPRHRRWLSCLVVLEPGFSGHAYPLPACCLLIACSGVLATIRIFNEMRLDYSPIHAGFAYKTTEQL